MLKYRGPSDTPEEYVTNYELELRIKDLQKATKDSKDILDNELESAIENYSPQLFKLFFNNDREALASYLFEMQNIAKTQEIVDIHSRLSKPREVKPANDPVELVQQIREMHFAASRQQMLSVVNVADLLMDSTKQVTTVSSLPEYDEFMAHIREEEGRFNEGVNVLLNKMRDIDDIDEMEELLENEYSFTHLSPI